MTEPEHLCHAHGCTRAVPPRMFMCYRHWRMVPKMMKDEIWATYLPGQERRKDPSPEYLAAARTAIDKVRELEAR